MSIFTGMAHVNRTFFSQSSKLQAGKDVEPLLVLSVFEFYDLETRSYKNPVMLHTQLTILKILCKNVSHLLLEEMSKLVCENFSDCSK